MVSVAVQRFRVQRFKGSGFWVLASGFWLLASGFWLLGSGFKGSGFKGLKVQGLSVAAEQKTTGIGLTTEH